MAKHANDVINIKFPINQFLFNGTMEKIYTLYVQCKYVCGAQYDLVYRNTVVRVMY